MNDSRLFVDEQTGQLDFDQLKAEIIPITKLMGVFAVFALGLLFWGVFMDGTLGPLGFLLFVASQFVLILGGAIVLMYTISRAITLANKARDESETDATSSSPAGESDRAEHT